MEVVLDQDGLPDPSAMVQRAIAADLDSAILKEREWDVAPNCIEWCTSHKYLNASDPLWPRQIQQLAMFFEDVCYFCSDVDYVHNIVVDDSIGNVMDRFCLLEHGVCPRCKRNRLEMLQSWQQDPRYSNYHAWDASVNLRGVPPNELVGIWGQRSGKSFSVATFFWPYILHRYLALPSIPKYFRLASNTVLEASFIAPTLKQVGDYMYTPFLNVFDASPWFREFVGHLKEEEKRIGITMFHRQQTFMTFPAKRLVVHMKAANSGTLRGGTRVFCVDGEALVNTTSGLISIKQVRPGMSVWVRNKAQRVTQQQETGRKPVQRTHLEDGYSVTTTLDHRIRVLTPDLDEVWKEAKDLQIGDYVGVGLGGEFPDELKLDYVPDRPVKRQLEAHRSMARLKTFKAAQVFEPLGLKGAYAITSRLIKRGMLTKARIKGQGRGAVCVYNVTDKFDLDLITAEYENHAFKNRDTCTFPDAMTVELGYLLGYYVSEGAYAKSAVEFSFSNTDEIVLQHFMSCFETVFGFRPRISSFDHPSEKQATGYNVPVAYKVVKKFLRYIGMDPSVAGTKSIPWSILQAPREVVLAFLSAYIEGDGSIGTGVVTMPSTSRKLIHQLQQVLLQLGITSTIYERKRAAPQNDIWTLRLRKYDSIKLVQQLTCPTKGRLFNFNLGKLRADTYRVPFVPAFKDTSQFGGSVLKYAYVIQELNKASYDGYALRRLAVEDKAKYDKVASLVDTGVVWLSVVKKKQLGSSPVYDITVDSDAHEFVADGVVVHNCTLDELGHFNSTDDGKKRAGIKDGTEVFTSLNRSLRTVRTRANKRRKLGDHNSLDGYMFCISSPSSVNDPIEQRAAIASKSPRMMHTRFCTWEVNPEEDEETIMEEEGSDMIKFKRDYCAQPPRAASPFIQNSPLLKQLVDHEQTTKHLFTYEIAAAEDRDTGTMLLRPTVKRRAADKLTPRVLTIDNGEKVNSFAVTMASYYPEHDGTLLEEFLEVAPYQHHQVDLQWCYDELILGLVKTFNVVHVFFDQWESSYAIRDLRTNYGIDAQRYSLKWKDFHNFREDLLGSKVWFPVPECEPDELLLTNNLVERARTPRAHFQLQLTTVNQFGKQVVKPDQGNDDLFRCAVLAHWAIQNHKDNYRGRHRGRRNQGKRQVAFGRAGSRGAGGSGGFNRSQRRSRRY